MNNGERILRWFIVGEVCGCVVRECDMWCEMSGIRYTMCECGVYGVWCESYFVFVKCNAYNCRCVCMYVCLIVCVRAIRYPYCVQCASYTT